MRNCWIWSVCLVLGGALSANADLLDATMIHGSNVSISYNWDQTGAEFDVVSVYIKSLNGPAAGFGINSLEGTFSAQAGVVPGYFLVDGSDTDNGPTPASALAPVRYLYKAKTPLNGTWLPAQSQLAERADAPKYSLVNFSAAIGAPVALPDYWWDGTNGLSSQISGTFAKTLDKLANTNMPPPVFGPTATTDVVYFPENLTASPTDIDRDGYQENLLAKFYVQKGVDKISFGDSGGDKFGYNIGTGAVEVTQFVMTPTIVPEPGTMALLLTGGLALAGFGWRRRK